MAILPVNPNFLRWTASIGRNLTNRLAVLLLLLTGMTSFAQNSAIPALRVVGNKVKDPAGNDVVLRGMSFTWIHHTVPTYGIQFIVDKAMNEWHAKVLRLPVEPGAFLPDKDAYYNNYIKPTVDYITSKGGYVIIDLHYIAKPADNDANVKAAWAYLAPKFAGYQNVFYELFNEPTSNTVNSSPTITWSAYKTLMNGWIKTVRDAGAPNLLLCAGLHYSQHIREFATDFFTDPMSGSRGLAGVWHAYPGSWSRDGSYYSEFDAAVAKVPVFITEWGWDEDKNGKDQNGNGVIDNWERYWGDVYGSQEKLEAFRTTFRDRVESKGGHHTGWVFNRNRDGWVPVMCNDDWTPRPWPRYHGSYTKDWLYNYRNSDQPASGSTPPPSVSTPYRMDAGRTVDYTDPAGNVWKADVGYSGGSTASVTNAIENTTNDVIYQTERYGMSGYTFAVANGTYKVNLHFSENYTGITAAGQRVFSANVEGTAISNIDIYGETGGRNRALIKTATVTVNDGTLNVSFTASVQNAVLNGLEILSSSTSSPASETRIETGNAASYTDNAGKVWAADNGFSGGNVVDRGNITIANTSNPKIYQTERYGMSGYALTVPNGSYTVKLHFAETYFTAAGQRVFNVNVEGATLDNLDVFAQAGAANKALVRTFAVTVSDGQLNIGFTAITNNAIINGIEILAVTARRVEAGNTGNFTDGAGNVWAADNGYTGGTAYDNGSIAIANTTNDRLYQTERYGANGSNFSYAFAVPSGSYTVNLHFAENYSGITAAGQRVFNVNVEGTALSNIDVYALAGNARNTAVVRSATVTVSDGTLNISFSAIAGKQNALVNAIEILSGSGARVAVAKEGAAEDQPEAVTVYPVPASRSFTIRFGQPIEQGRVLVQDVLGRTFHDLRIQTPTREVEVDATGMQNGLYFVTIPAYNHHHKIVKRVVIQK